MCARGNNHSTHLPHTIASSTFISPLLVSHTQTQLIQDGVLTDPFVYLLLPAMLLLSLDAVLVVVLGLCGHEEDFVNEGTTSVLSEAAGPT